MYKELLLSLEIMCCVAGESFVSWQELLHVLKRKGKSTKVCLSRKIISWKLILYFSVIFSAWNWLRGKETESLNACIHCTGGRICPGETTAVRKFRAWNKIVILLFISNSVGPKRKRNNTAKLNCITVSSFSPNELSRFSLPRKGMWF